MSLSDLVPMAVIGGFLIRTRMTPTHLERCDSCSIHPAGTFADLSHVKAAILILVLVAAQGDYPEPRVQAKTMKNQGESSQSGLVVTVIDDDLAVRNALKFWLEIEGLTVRSYASGADLLSAGDLARCDCFAIDQKMPAMSGLDLIAQLRDRHFTAPAILITSHPSVSLRERAEKADVPIMEKPLLENGLLDKIRDLVGDRQS